MESIRKIKHVVYINLEHRTDRKEQVEQELKNIGFYESAQRFDAIKAKDGRIGCTLSHLKCLENAKEQNLPHIMIIEDDIQFLKPQVFKNNLNDFLSSGTKWDVILVGGNNVPPYQVVHKYGVKVTHCQTTTGYIINQSYYDTLIENIRLGLKMLMRNPEHHCQYAIDKFWIHLQRKDTWILITPLTVTQRESFSDIENRVTSYTSAMIDIDKKRFF